MPHGSGFDGGLASGERKFAPALLSASYSTAQTGATVDCRMVNGQMAKTVTFVINVGTTTDGTIDFTFEEDDNTGFTSATAVPASRIFGPTTGTGAPSITTANHQTVYAVAVKPNERYIRVKTVETVANTGILLGIAALLEAF